MFLTLVCFLGGLFGGKSDPRDKIYGSWTITEEIKSTEDAPATKTYNLVIPQQKEGPIAAEITGTDEDGVVVPVLKIGIENTENAFTFVITKDENEDAIPVDLTQLTGIGSLNDIDYSYEFGQNFFGLILYDQKEGTITSYKFTKPQQNSSSLMSFMPMIFMMLQMFMMNRRGAAGQGQEGEKQ